MAKRKTKKKLSNNKNSKSIYILGGLFGFIAPFLGLFVGLQISSFLGTLFSFPAIFLTFITEIPFGNFTGSLKLFAWFLSIVSWSAIFGLISKIIHHYSKS